jgi:hypothetical protein
MANIHQGNGLGVNQDGQTDFIRVQKKEDSLGVGADPKAANVWQNNHSVAYSSLLENLHAKYAKKPEAAEPDAKSEGGSSDNEARKKRKAEKKALKKAAEQAGEEESPPAVAAKQEEEQQTEQPRSQISRHK